MIRGLNSSYGFYITTVNGIRADETREEWWSLTKNGEYVEYGVDMIHIQDKDKYELTLMKGY